MNRRGVYIAAAFIINIYILLLFNTRGEMFHIEGARYFFYNLARLFFLCFLTWTMYFIGNILCMSCDVKRSCLSDKLLNFSLKSGCGMGATIVFIFILGVFNLYYFVVLCLYMAIVLCLSGPCLDKAFLSVRDSIVDCSYYFKNRVTCNGNFNTFGDLLFSLLCMILFLVLVFKRGFVIDYGDNDIIGGYVPFMYTVVEQVHGFFPTNFFIHYFITKGAGLHVLVSQLVDPYSIQLVGVQALIVSFAVFLSISWKIVKDVGIVSVFGSIFLLAFAVSLGKMHILIGSLVCCSMLYVTKVLSQHEETRLRKERVGLFFLLAGQILILPGSIVLTFFLYFIAFVVLWFKNKKNIARQMLLFLVVQCCVVLAVYVFNLLQTGVVDYQLKDLENLPFFISFTKAWDPFTLLFSHHSNLSDGNISFPSMETFFKVVGLVFFPDPSKLDNTVRSCVALILIMVSFYKIFPKARSFESKRLRAIGLTSLLFIFTVVSFRLFFVHGAIDRFTKISIVPALWVFLIVYTKFVEHVGSSRWLKLFLIFSVIVINLNGFRLAISHSLDERISFLWEGSYASVIDSSFPVRNGIEALKHVPDGHDVLALNFSPGLYALPGQNFQRPLQNRYANHLYYVLYGDPQEAISVLRRDNVEYAFLNLNETLLFTILAPVFSPESLVKNWRIVWRSDSAPESYLLTCNPDVGSPIPADFAAKIRKLIRKSGVVFEDTYSAMTPYANTMHFVPQGKHAVIAHDYADDLSIFKSGMTWPIRHGDSMDLFSGGSEEYVRTVNLFPVENGGGGQYRTAFGPSTELSFILEQDSNVDIAIEIENTVNDQLLEIKINGISRYIDVLPVTTVGGKPIVIHLNEFATAGSCFVEFNYSKWNMNNSIENSPDRYALIFKKIIVSIIKPVCS